MNNYSKVMQKHGKSFFWASWFLDKNTANKLFTVYALCRRLDDLVDTSNENSEAKEEIARVISLTNNNQYKETFEEFKRIDSKLHPRQDIITEFLKGQLSDLDFRQPNDLGQLLKYCYRVAGVVGLMICDVLDIRDSKLRYFAIDFGIAMQLTNICRDIKEDAQIGRIYLPKNETASLAIGNFKSPSNTDLIIINSSRDKLIKLADKYYQSGMYGINQLPIKIKRSFRVASNIYQGIGHKILQKRCSFNEQRVYLSKFEKLSLTIKTFLKRSKFIDRPLHQKKLHASLQNLPDTDH
jgi:phytoene synthase